MIRKTLGTAVVVVLAVLPWAVSAEPSTDIGRAVGASPAGLGPAALGDRRAAHRLRTHGGLRSLALSPAKGSDTPPRRAPSHTTHAERHARAMSRCCGLRAAAQGKFSSSAGSPVSPVAFARRAAVAPLRPDPAGSARRTADRLQRCDPHRRSPEHGAPLCARHRLRSHPLNRSLTCGVKPWPKCRSSAASSAGSRSRAWASPRWRASMK